jgi:hypothetical protein
MIIGMEALTLIIGIPLVYILARDMASQYGWIAALRPYVWFHLVLFLLLRQPPPSLYNGLLLVLSALFLAYICRHELTGEFRKDFLLAFKYGIVYYIGVAFLLIDILYLTYIGIINLQQETLSYMALIATAVVFNALVGFFRLLLRFTKK